MGLSLAPMVAVMLALTPEQGGALNIDATVINDSPGDQSDPHVDGDLAAYADDSSGSIHYYRFSDGSDQAIPSPALSHDILSDVNDERIVFTRLHETAKIMLFEVATQTLTELAPAPASSHFGVALGGQTAAFIDYTSDPLRGEVVVLDLDTGLSTAITNDLLFQQAVAVSPDGNVVVFETCSDGNHCVISYAKRGSGGAWVTGITSLNSLRDREADTNGELVVFQREDPASVGTSSIVIVNLTTGDESVLDLPGAQFNPSIRGDILAFEHRVPGDAYGDLFLVQLSTGRIFQLTDTPNVRESFNDVTVLPNGDIRVVWQASEGVVLGLNDVFGATFSLPVDPGTCEESEVVLEAWRKSKPAKWFDDVENFSPAFTFEIPAELPVVEGKSGGPSKKAYLFITVDGKKVSCEYRGTSGSGDAYVFKSCTTKKKGKKGGWGWGGGCKHGNGDDDDDDDAPQYTAGTAVTADSVHLHVKDGDSSKPKTKVRVSLGAVCSGDDGGDEDEGDEGEANPGKKKKKHKKSKKHHGGCSSTGDAVLPTLMLLAMAMLLTRRPIAARVGQRRK